MLSAPTGRMPPHHQRPRRPVTRLANLLVIALLMVGCAAERPVTATPTVLVPEATPTPTATPTPSAPICPMSGAGPLSGLSQPIVQELSLGPEETFELVLGIDPNLTGEVRYQVQAESPIQAALEGPNGQRRDLDGVSGSFQPWQAGRYRLELTRDAAEARGITLQVQAVPERQVILPYATELGQNPQVLRELTTPGLRLLRLEVPAGKSLALNLMVPAGSERIGYTIVVAQPGGLLFVLLGPDHTRLDEAAVCGVYQGGVSLSEPGPYVLLLDNSDADSARAVSLLVQMEATLIDASPIPTVTASATPAPSPIGTASPSPTVRPGSTATPVLTPTPSRTPTPTPIVAATPSLPVSTLSLSELGVVGEHFREIAVPRGQALRLAMPLDERRVSRVQWWLESRGTGGAVRFQVIAPDGALLDRGAVGVLNLGAFPVATGGSYALLLENAGSETRTFQLTAMVSGR